MARLLGDFLTDCDMERGVVFFRDQDLTLEKQHEFTSHYGIVRPPHHLPASRSYD